MSDKTIEFEGILKEESSVLDKLLAAQSEMKDAVTNKDWDSLNVAAEKINSLSDSFMTLDVSRQRIQDLLSKEERAAYNETLLSMRSRLLKFKVQNEAINKYVNITHDFIQEVLDKAVPQRAAKVYSPKGMVKKQPQSVVLDQLF